MKKLRRKQLKEDKFVESIFSTRLFFSRHVKLLIFLGIAVAATVAITTFIISHRRSMNRKASMLFMEARGADAFLEIYHTYQRSTVAPIALYEAAKVLYVDGRYGEAGENFRLFIRDYPDHSLVSEALNSVGYCLEAEGHVLQAAETYRNVAEEYAGSAIAPDALINSARCYRLAGRDGEARKQYERVIRDFPGSFRRLDAERYLARLENAPEELDSDKGEG